MVVHRQARAVRVGRLHRGLAGQPHEPPLERGEHARKVVPPLQHLTMFGDQCERPLLQAKRGAFLDPHLGPLAMAAVGREDRNVGIDPQRIIAPVAGGDHSSIEVEDPQKLLSVEAGNWAPVPGWRERRDDAQALLTFACG